MTERTRLTADDEAAFRMLAGAHFGPRASLTLPSGRTITGDEAQAFTSFYAPAAGDKSKPPPTLPSKPPPTLPSKPHPKPAKDHAPAVANAGGQTGPDHTPPYVDGADGLEAITGPHGDWDKKEPVIGCRQAALKLAICILGLGVILATAVFVTMLAAMGLIG